MSNKKDMTLKLKIWRQKNTKAKGNMEDYDLSGVSPDMSFLEMLDLLNEKLVHEGAEPVVFDHDCREGICGTCSLMINGMPHGGEHETTTCQLHMRKFEDGQTVVIEPFRAKAFPVLRDLMTDRSALDKMIAAGGYVSVNTGNAQDANNIPVNKIDAELAMDAAACIGCAACVASCKNASPMLFLAAKVSQFALLPQGQIEKSERVAQMVEKMDELGFGNCTNEAECEATCPKGVSIGNIARLNREFLSSSISTKK